MLQFERLRPSKAWNFALDHKAKVLRVPLDEILVHHESLSASAVMDEY